MSGKIICKGSGGNNDKFIRRFKTLINSSNHSDPKVRKSKKILLITAAWQKSEFEEGHLKKVLNEIGIPSSFDENGYDVNIQNLSIYFMFNNFKKKCPELYDLYHEKQETIIRIKDFYRTKNLGMIETYWEQVKLLQKHYPKMTLHEILNYKLDEKIIDHKKLTPQELEKLFFCRQVQNTMQNIITYDQKMVNVVEEMDEHFTSYSKLKENLVYQEKRKRLEERILTSNSIFILDGHISVLMNRLRFFDLRDAFVEALNRGTNFYLVGSGAEILCDKMILFNSDKKLGDNQTEHFEFYDNGFGIIKNIQIMPKNIDEIDFSNKELLTHLANRFNSHTSVFLNKGSYLFMENQIDEEANSQEVKYISIGGSKDYLQVFSKDGVVEKVKTGEEIFPSREHKRFQNLIERHTSKNLAELLKRVFRLSKIHPSGIEKAVENFIVENSFPLREKLVTTFFYYDPTGKVESVYLESALGFRGDNNVFFQYQNTGIFYFPLEFQPNSRLEYKIALDFGNGQREILDPYNPNLANAPFGPKSVMTTLDYKPTIFSISEERTESYIERFEFDSKIMKDKREFQIYTPKEFENEALPIVVFHDGYDYLRFSNLQKILDSMIYEKAIKPIRGIFTKPIDRRNEYAASPDYAKFISEELIEEIGKHKKLPSGKENFCTVGASFGGLISLYLMDSYPKVFGNALCQSGSFFMKLHGFDYYTSHFPKINKFVNSFVKSKTKIDSKVVLTCGRFESLVYLNREMVEVLDKRNCDYKYFENNDGHTWTGWANSMPQGLINIFGNPKKVKLRKVGS
ncbi:MAG: esterase family protein [Calditrichaeota bacterium]|nr:MAG: esterase family protein [Calditrichota bacterium]